MDLRTFLAHKATIREMTARTVACVPEESLSARPAPTSRTFAEIVLHIMQAEHLFTNILAATDDPVERPFTTEGYPTREALVEGLRAQGATTAEKLAALPAERLAASVRAPFGLELPGTAWLLLLASHEAEHRGNLVIIAKQQGFRPPDVTELLLNKARGSAS